MNVVFFFLELKIIQAMSTRDQAKCFVNCYYLRMRGALVYITALKHNENKLVINTVIKRKRHKNKTVSLSALSKKLFWKI